DTLYVATADGRIVLIDAATGTVGETLRTSDRRIWGSPAFQGGTLYIGDLDNGTTVAIDATSGDVVWEQEISGPSAADLLLDGDLLIVGAFDQHLHALEVANGGQERWAFPGDGWFLARPLVSDGIVYAATMNGVVYAIDRATGAEVWSFVAGEDAEFRAAPVIAAGHLIAIARDGRVFALDLQSGDVAWQQDATLEGNVNANPTVVDSDIYLVTSRHELVRVDASSNGAFQTVPLAAAGQ
ncbi:MAG: PQQ-binding-like beta-propeller repeat protein, partial [Dehalococcoidia bacterium]|nr:PQQ-binding-like beta-propeller repeat protein [Dehalococcoidia bacterium]